VYERERHVNAIATGIYNVTESLISDILKTMDDIPEEALNSWKPAAAQEGGGEMNTFAAIAIHTASAGRWMLVHQAFGEEFSRDREGEFHATASRAAIEAKFQEWLGDLRERLERLDDVDLTQMPPTVRDTRPNWTRSHWLIHMVDHTGIHLGHLQIQRQLWDAERNGLSSDRTSIH
jgi:hypothetical protein